MGNIFNTIYILIDSFILLQVIHAYLGLKAQLRNVGGANEIFIFPSQLANVWETGEFGNWLFRNVSRKFIVLCLCLVVIDNVEGEVPQL